MNRSNPFRRKNKWYWYDGLCFTHGPYPSERKALRDLLVFSNRWERFKALLSEFVHS